MTELKGLWAASVTPLQPDLAPDPTRLASHIEWLFQNGCHGVVLFGTTGEANSFSVSERRALLDELASNGTEMSRVVVGTGLCAVPDSVELTKHAVSLGCAGVLMLPPFYYKVVTEDGLFAAISNTIEQSKSDDLRVVLYHFPRMSGTGYSVPLIQRLKTAYPDILAGIKDSSGDTDNLTRYCREIDDLAVFAGSEALLPYALEEGGVGCVSATANLTSRLVREVYDGDKPAADKMIRTRKALEALPMVPMLKHILATESGDEAWNRVRPPLIELTTASQARLGEIVDTVGTLPNFKNLIA